MQWQPQHQWCRYAGWSCVSDETIRLEEVPQIGYWLHLRSRCYSGGALALARRACYRARPLLEIRFDCGHPRDIERVQPTGATSRATAAVLRKCQRRVTLTLHATSSHSLLSSQKRRRQTLEAAEVGGHSLSLVHASLRSDHRIHRLRVRRTGCCRRMRHDTSGCLGC